jgi:hypothetical protein
VLEAVVADLPLTDEADAHLSPLLRPDGHLQTSTLYHRLVARETAQDDATQFVWDNAAPPRVRFFGWLLSRDRIQSKVNLKIKAVVVDATCELCNAGDETSQHIMFDCPFARVFWLALGFRLPSGHTVKELHMLPRPSGVPSAHYATFILLCCWQLWKRCNSFVFRQETFPMRHLLRLCKDDAELWSHMLPSSSRAVAHLWCNFLSAAM